MKMKILLVTLCTIAVSSIFAQPKETTGQASDGKPRIGTYDSRAIAVAFAGSPTFKTWMDELKAEHAQAKASGDKKRVAALEAEGQARQRLLHMQGFSTAPVTNILERIRAKLPVIQKKANVSAFVSKWDTDELARHTDSERIDVTTLLIDALEPNARQRKYAAEIQAQKPVPLKQATNIHD